MALFDQVEVGKVYSVRIDADHHDRFEEVLDAYAVSLHGMARIVIDQPDDDDPRPRLRFTIIDTKNR